jgi:mono/diheme cytochrome c family protein
MKYPIALACLLVLANASVAMAAKPEFTPALLEKGKAAFKTNCESCHGPKGDGMGMAGQYMNPKPRNLNKDKFKAGETPEQVFKSISEGLPGTSMAGFVQLPEEDRWALVQYVLTFRPKK